ncbi:MAG: rod shape-determining protein MreB [Candidatus Xenobia bacterium]
MRLAIDLGSSNIRVHEGKRAALSEPSLVAVETASQKVIAVGNDAQAMVGRVPPHISLVRPLQGGVIANTELALALLKYCMQHVTHGVHRFMRPNITLCVGARSTSTQKAALVHAATAAGAREVRLIEAPLAAALGAGVDVRQPRGALVIHVGAAATDVAAMYMGKQVIATAGLVGGNTMDEAIRVRLRQDPHYLEISTETAERLKIQLGTAIPMLEDLSTEVAGRDLGSGLPRRIQLTSTDVREALTEPLQRILDTVQAALLKVPPELASDIVEHGAILTGGSSLLRGLNQYLAVRVHVPIHLARDPLSAVLRGAWMAQASPLPDSASRKG